MSCFDSVEYFWELSEEIKMSGSPVFANLNIFLLKIRPNWGRQPQNEGILVAPLTIKLDIIWHLHSYLSSFIGFQGYYGSKKEWYLPQLGKHKRGPGEVVSNLKPKGWVGSSQTWKGWDMRFGQEEGSERRLCSSSMLPIFPESNAVENDGCSWYFCDIKES